MPETKLFLIDAHALCYRSFFAIKSLTNSQGQATNAVYGFINTLRKIIRDYQPAYMGVCFDSAKKTLRQERFKDYKINRPSMPDDLVSQIPIIKNVVEAYNFPVFEMEGFEADDLIATLAKNAQKNNIEVIVVSDDKDMLQLVDKDVKIFSIRKDKVLGDQEAQDLFGIDPARIPDFIALAGDKTDNIPGVLGIGEVTAKNLINRFGTLENILSHVDEIEPAKVKEKIMQQKENAIFSKELALLDCQVPIPFDLTKLKVGQPDHNRLFQLFKDLEFKKFADEISSNFKSESTLVLKTIQNSQDISSLKDKIKKIGEFSFLLDCSEPYNHASCTGVYLACDSEEVFYLSIDSLNDFKEIFEDPKIVKLTHNLKQGMKVFEAKNCLIKGRIFDAMLAGYLLAPSQGNYEIEALAWIHLKKSSGPEPKGARETIFLLELYPVLLRDLEEKDLLKLFEEIEIPLAYVLFRMEQSGVCLDQPFLEKLSIETEKKIEAIVGKIYELAGTECNLNSPKQLSVVLFEKLKLPVIKKTKTGFSTDEGVLTKLAEKYEIAALIIEFRQLSKLKSTYFDALPKMINPQTGRVHAYFNQTGTETGRLSSINPNLQNIPIRTDLGRQIRKAFLACQNDHIIISADYSQIELRILAHLSQDENLMQAFQSDEDIHTYTSSLIFYVKESDVTKDMRNSAKRVNFGIIYGISAFGLAKDLSISQQEAQTFIDKYFLRYPKVKEFMDNEIQKAEELGYVLTLLNRRRYLPEINSRNIQVKQFAERQAINTPVQGSAADLMKLAMINIQKEIEKESVRTRMIITVHDELVFDGPKDEEDLMVQMIRREMENCLKLSVPVKASVKTGKNWLEMKEV